MNRTKVNFVVDAIALIAFVFLTATGFLIYYTLPAGSGHFTQIWGLDRHEWGQIHFWIAIIILAALAIHVILHWRWIVSLVKGRPGEGSGYRVGLGILGIIMLTVLVLSPFFGIVERRTDIHPRKQRFNTQTFPQERSGSQRFPGNVYIRGYMTLQQVENQTGISYSIILNELGLPSDLSKNEKIGNLRRLYGFDMNELRNIVQKYKNK
jgi:hypothetical protein